MSFIVAFLAFGVSTWALTFSVRSVRLARHLEQRLRSVEDNFDELTQQEGAA